MLNLRSSAIVYFIGLPIFTMCFYSHLDWHPVFVGFLTTLLTAKCPPSLSSKTIRSLLLGTNCRYTMESVSSASQKPDCGTCLKMHPLWFNQSMWKCLNQALKEWQCYSHKATSTLQKQAVKKKRVKHQTIPCCTDSAKKRANHPISSHSFLSLPKHPLFLAGFFYLYLLLSQLFAPISQLWFSSSLPSFTAFPLSRTLTIPFITTYRGPLNKAIPTEKITSFFLFFPPKTSSNTIS